MRRSKKKRYSVIQTFTPFERNKSKEIQELVRMGIDPRTVTNISIGGETKMQISDFLNLFELTGKKFDVVATSITRKGEQRVRAVFN